MSYKMNHLGHLNALSIHEMSFPSKLVKSLNLRKLTSTRYELNHG